MLSSVVSNAIGFTSYETGLRWYREYNPGRSPTPMERACIAGGISTSHLVLVLSSHRVMAVLAYHVWHSKLPVVFCSSASRCAAPVITCCMSWQAVIRTLQSLPACWAASMGPMYRMCIGGGAVTVMTCIMPFEVIMRRLQVSMQAVLASLAM